MRRMLAETRMDRHTLEGMAADMTTPRLCGPCTHGHHNYCLGAKIAQIVTPDGLGDLNPLNLLWIEKMEREDASNERT